MIEKVPNHKIGRKGALSPADQESHPVPRTAAPALGCPLMILEPG